MRTDTGLGNSNSLCLVPFRKTVLVHNLAICVLGVSFYSVYRSVLSQEQICAI